MKTTGRNAALALVALLGLLWTLARYRGGSGARPATPAPRVFDPVRAVTPPAPVVAPAKAKKTAPKKTAAKIVAQPEKPVEPAKVRGAKLRDKGEAMGGRTPGRVFKDTATATTSQ